jgi:hypothetical protein
MEGAFLVEVGRALGLTLNAVTTRALWRIQRAYLRFHPRSLRVTTLFYCLLAVLVPTAFRISRYGVKLSKSSLANRPAALNTKLSPMFGDLNSSSICTFRAARISIRFAFAARLPSKNS